MDAPRRIEQRYRVRFDEADADGWLRPSGLLRYAQDMAWRHSEEAGFDRDWYTDRSMHWLVRNVALSIKERVTHGDTLTVSTEVIGWRHVWARRRSEVRRVVGDAGATSGDVAAVVDTDWVLLTVTGRPARVPGEIERYFSPGHTFTRSRVVLTEPPDGVVTLSTRVRPLDLDPMGHMNNAAYLDLVDDGLARLPEWQRIDRPGCYRVGYVRPALPASAIVVSSWPMTEGSIACRISDDAGNELTRVIVSRPGA